MTPHNTANPGDIASIVLMPGDPLRAKFIAETFLENPVCVNSVRNCLGYTGTWKGTPVSVMASGMGMPSLGIYAWELFTQYGVNAIVRIGSAGGCVPSLHAMDVVLAKDAWSQSSFAKTAFHDNQAVQKPTPLIQSCFPNIKQVRLHSSDVFYCCDDSSQQDALNAGCEAVEMESFALFATAKHLGKEAACLCTISDSFVHEEDISPEVREKGFQEMAVLALDGAAAFVHELEKAHK
jgi:purine-nucleoside phosphorylase